MRKINYDWITIGLFILLTVIGWLAVYTTDYNGSATGNVLNFSRAAGRQFIWLLVAYMVAFFIQLIDSRIYTKFAQVFYAFAILLLLITLGLGSVISGSKSWIKLGGSLGFQPSEFAKVATCLALAAYIGIQRTKRLDIEQQLSAGFIIMVPAVLTLLQGDAGSALVFASLSLALYREGMALQVLLLGLLAITLFVFSLKLPFYFGILLILFVGILFLLITKQANWRNIALCLVTMLVVFAIQSGAPEMVAIIAFGIAATSLTLWSFMRRQAIWGLMAFMLTCSLYTQSVNYVFTNILKPHQQNRIAVVLGIVEDNRGVGYNVNQSKIAIGSGGLWGKGYLQGTQNKGNFVPEMHTDFIFCSIGEEFGLVGSVGLITLFVFLFLRLIVIGERQTSDFSRVYAYSVTAILFFHFLVNIGMTIGLMPVIGIPLPYISYGGSGLLGFTILLFILVKLDSERNAHI